MFFLFFTELYADTNVERPNGNGTVAGTPSGCGAGGIYDCLNDVVTQPTTPSTGSDFVTWVNNDASFFQMGATTDVSSVSSITVWLYHVEGGTNAQQTIGLYAGNESTVYGAATGVTTRTSGQWDSITFSGLSLNQTQLDDMRVRVACTKVGGGTSNTCTAYAMYAEITYTRQIEVTVGSTGTQQNIAVGAVDAHVGGAFTITENIGARNVTSITIAENGTVNAATNLDNIRLYYDLDTTSPYNCASESYNGTENQFGTTDTDGFSGADGTSTFTGSVGISTTTTMCVYAVLDVGDGAASGETVELQITNPSTDVVADGSADVQPATAVSLSGSTILLASQIEQIHYHWRNDDGTESGATSVTGGTQDTTYNAFPRLTTKRIRFEVSNEGNASTPSAVSILDPMTSDINTFSKTISNGTNRLLVVAIQSEDSALKTNVDTVTYGGQTLTEVRDIQIGSGFSNGLWVGYLDEEGISAASGTSVTPTWVSGAADETVIYNAIVFEHVDQADPIPAWSSNTASGVSTIQPTTSIAVADGDAALYFTSSGAAGQSHIPATNYTEGTENSSGGSGSTAANAYRLITADGNEQPTADWGTNQTRLLLTALTVQFGYKYRLEYATKVTTCSAITESNWTDVGAVSDAWDMSSSQLVEGSDTTNVALGANGAVTDENTTFLTPNGGQRETSSETGTLLLSATEFVEIEYAVQASASAVDGTTYCFRLTNQGSPLDTYSVYPEATILADVTVSAVGTQRTSVDIPTSNVDAGANFVFTDNIAGTTTIQSITITASGTIDYQNDIDNIRLYYDLDTTSPYNCASESYNGTENQFGTTDTDGFSAGGISTFTGSIDLNVTQSACVYVVYDVGSGTSNDEQLDLKINNATNDVAISSGTVAPASLVDFTGVTTFVYDRTVQVHYHWRNDNGSESGASSATDAEDTLLENLRQESPIRLRIGIANIGSSTTPPYQYRLEYALRVSTCAAATGWTDVGSALGAFDMFDSSNITDGGSTTNIATTTGGVTDVGTTYLSSNVGLKDTSSQTGNITLPGKNYVDLEYAVEATASSTEGAIYCFRVTDAGTPIDAYDVYPRVEIKPRTDFFIQRDNETITGTSLTITAGVDYIAPASSSTAFIRITSTLNSGAGSGSTGNADDVTVYISNPGNIENNITFTRPTGATGNTRIAWEIIEYTGAVGGDNEFVVRNQSVSTYATGATTVNTPTISGVQDDADIVVFITGQLNPDTLTNYPLGNSTAAWNAGSDTATFTRGASGNAAGVSYAIVEFVGDNWRIQRSSHTYSAVGTTETDTSISALSSLSRAFIHTQKRMGSGLTTHGDYGHQVWLSGLAQVSYALDSTASTPGSHTSVAWIIENTQTIGTVMNVTRSNGTQSGGAAPLTLNVNIGDTIDDTQDASIFMNNFGNEPGGGGGQNSFPEPMMTVELISTTQYQLWIADTSDTRAWRVEVVEWPTAARNIHQNYYRFYVDNGALDPTEAWPCAGGPCGENTPIGVLDSPIESGDVMRLRMTLQISSAGMEPSLDAFTLQYAQLQTTCSAISETEWFDVGAIGSTTALWTGTSTALTDGAALSTDPPTAGDLNISVSDVAGTFEEENDSAFTPYLVEPGEDVEFDWAVMHNGAIEKTSYCFRMREANGTLFDDYFHYPVMRTAGFTPTLSQWQFYDDDTNETPTASLANENTAPTDIAYENIVKLRTTINESTGGTGNNIRFKLQFSEYSDFSTGVYDVVATTTCTENSLWCYADGAGVDGDVISTAVLSDADSCIAGVGDGCGIHNESQSTTTLTFDHQPYATAEYEFSLRHAGARANAVYYFRIYDVTNATTVPASTTYPSLVTEGAQLVFTISGLPTATSADQTILTDVSTTANTIPFGSVPLNTEYVAAQRLTVDTNATQGYQVLKYATGELLNTYGEPIPSINGTNASPVGWGTGCLSSVEGCFGYHVGDDTLGGGSTRFAAPDSYAALDTLPQEIMYSSVPAHEFSDIVYKIEVRDEQPAGEYVTDITYLVIPVF